MCDHIKSWPPNLYEFPLNPQPSVPSSMELSAEMARLRAIIMATPEDVLARPFFND